ncbi:hypothetical protein ACKUB1_06655 [Methanospirillum stamsii]|uniref:Uncharacterized protein n=1 Tax=Methanospirillum stamsii TaxID=1277351 RepID=A0A2V2NI69_9EURY|nr:hypothetical protein [Methanospirillum stamsii]PWR76058.1 hypothetical protein DLD82_00740 [Methanospirillum stamsii]
MGVEAITIIRTDCLSCCIRDINKTPIYRTFIANYPTLILVTSNDDRVKIDETPKSRFNASKKP